MPSSLVVPGSALNASMALINNAAAQQLCFLACTSCNTHSQAHCGNMIMTHRLAAELEEEGASQGPAAEGPAGAAPVSEEVLESLRGMEQQVQMALLELQKKDQQLAQERSCTSRFKVSLQQGGESELHLPLLN